MNAPEKFLYSRAEAAAALSISVSTLCVMIGRGMLEVRRQGRRVFIHRSELEKHAKRDIDRLWPPKVPALNADGVMRMKTVNAEQLPMAALFQQEQKAS
jgi:excisionase family DNA binding protein